MTDFHIILILIGFSTLIQAVTAGLIITVLAKGKKSDEKIAQLDGVAQKTLAKATAANFAAAGLLELDA